MKRIKLTQGKYAIVDDEDYHYLSRFNWSIDKSEKYPCVFREFSINGRVVIIPMWKFVIPTENNKSALYLNRNSLDNRKENLRVVPEYIANHYSEKRSIFSKNTPSSVYKGVSYSRSYKGKKKWIADIVCNGKRFNGHFLTEVEAALAYNEKAREFYSDYAYQNIIYDRATQIVLDNGEICNL